MRVGVQSEEGVGSVISEGVKPSPGLDLVGEDEEKKDWIEVDGMMGRVELRGTITVKEKKGRDANIEKRVALRKGRCALRGRGRGRGQLGKERLHRRHRPQQRRCNTM